MPPGAPDPVALARLYGEPLFALPTDLYIPPDALEVFLDAFEGPLDLLLYLIRRQNFDILDIPLADVTRQYLAYVEQVRRSNLELASDYLLMAAVLIEIKSRMLLPARPAADGAEPEDPRAELVRRLLEYEQMKRAAARLDALPLAGRDFFPAQVHVERPAAAVRFPDVSPDDLRAAWRDILRRARLVRHHTVTREQLSVREHMGLMLRRLQGRRYAAFEELFDPARGAAVLVVTFIALLELSREQLVEVTQAEAYRADLRAAGGGVGPRLKRATRRPPAGRRAARRQPSCQRPQPCFFPAPTMRRAMLQRCTSLGPS